jgi:hypothetical protein
VNSDKTGGLTNASEHADGLRASTTATASTELVVQNDPKNTVSKMQSLSNYTDDKLIMKPTLETAPVVSGHTYIVIIFIYNIFFAIYMSFYSCLSKAGLH